MASSCGLNVSMATGHSTVPAIVAVYSVFTVPSPFADSQSEGNATVHVNPAWQLPQLDPLDLDNDGMGQYFDLDNPDQQEFWYQDETVGTRAARGTRNDQPAYVFWTQIEKVRY